MPQPNRYSGEGQTPQRHHVVRTRALMKELIDAMVSFAMTPSMQ